MLGISNHASHTRTVPIAMKDLAPSMRLPWVRPVAYLILPLMISVAAQAASEGADALRRYGHVEPLLLVGSGTVVDALLDTGAEHSSLHAEEIATFRRNGQRWVRFTVVGNDGTRSRYEKPLERRVRIVGRPDTLARRPVVVMELCVGEVLRAVEVNLTDRSELSYPALVGRSFLSGAIVVDTAQTHLTEPGCG